MSERNENADVVLAVTARLRDSNDGEHPESWQVKEELARMFIESQAIVRELRRSKDILSQLYIAAGG